MRLLVVEDEKKIAALLRKALSAEGFSVDVATRGDEALGLLCKEPYSAVILDIMLPGTDGLSVLRTMREKRITMPVMLLTARGEVSDRIEGLNQGADDYMAKPFSVDELIARLRALMRRANGETLSLFKVGDLTVNLVSRDVRRGARKVDLTIREFNLLEFFMRNPGQVFTRSQIHQRVWNYNFDPGTNLVDVYIQRLRRKIDDEEPVKLIQTVRGEGYCITAGP
jgi:two-component system, OmpR family, response regulator